MSRRSRAALVGASWLILGVAALHQAVSLAQAIVDVRTAMPLVVEIEPEPMRESRRR